MIEAYFARVEAEKMFEALKKQSVETVMVMYVDECHGIRRMLVKQLDSMRRTMAWFDKHMKGVTSST